MSFSRENSTGLLHHDGEAADYLLDLSKLLAEAELNTRALEKARVNQVSDDVSNCSADILSN